MIDWPAELVATAALVVTAAGLVAAALTAAATRRPLVALKVLLDFLLAAGLLRLTGDPDWATLLTAAVIVALRRLLGFAIRTGAPAWASARGR